MLRNESLCLKDKKSSAPTTTHILAALITAYMLNALEAWIKNRRSIGEAGVVRMRVTR